jgi:translocation and assembly module TamB
VEESDRDPVARSTGRRLAIAAGLGGSVALAALLAAWTERQPIVAHFVDDRLAAAHVPAAYRIVAIGPFVQRLENVRIGDPAAPDLTARSVELHLGYDFSGPYLRTVVAEGVRLSARLIRGRVSLGAVDRLLPASSSAALALPDIGVTLNDMDVALDTPAGAVGASIEGRGNLADGFSGRVTVAAPLLATGGCAIRGTVADLRVTIADRKPRVAGPLDLAALACPPQGLALSKGRATLDMSFARTLDHWQGGAALVGFAGRAGVVRFGGASGMVTIAGDTKRIDGSTGLTFKAVSSPVASARIAQFGGRYRFIPGSAGLVFAGEVAARGAALVPDKRSALLVVAQRAAGTPMAPLVVHAAGGLDRLLGDATTEARIAFAAGGSAGAGFSVRTLVLTGRDGGFVRIAEGDGFGWQARDRKWRVDGRVTTGGGAIPALDARLDQSVAGAPVDGVARLAPYAAGGARLTILPLTFRSSGAVTRFATTATLDGPLGTGRVEGLTIPITGRFDTDGTLLLGEGCIPVRFRSLTVGAIALDPARIGLCGKGGAPLVSGRAGDTLRYGATVNNLRLTGRSGGVPLSIAAARIEASPQGAAVRQLALQLGQNDAITRFDADSIDGTVDHGAFAGPFAGATAEIAHVPLRMTELTGRWTLADGALALTGHVTVSDAETVPRFAPLIAHEATLRFANGRIDANGGLHEPKTDALIANVVIRHDLARGIGGAILDVPGLHFAPKGLQPETLTPLTLGVIANTAGAVIGQGRIDWTGQGVTSSGSFHTDGIDLAAAFGPVSRIVGTITFSDLLGMVTPPHQEATIAEINPGVAVSNGVVHYQLLAGQKVKVEDARWPFAGGELILDPSLLSFEQTAQRHLTFRITRLDAAAFVQQLAFPNIAATGIFDGTLPMIFDQAGGRIDGGALVARRGGGTLAYVGELSNAQLGTMGKLAFDALKAIRYNSLSIGLNGRLDGEIVSSVTFDGVRQETGETTMAARLIRNLPFRFNIQIRAPFRGLMGSARAFVDPSVLLQNGVPPATAPSTPPAAEPGAVQPVESEPVR